jgi:hypothetical protein
MLEKQRAAAAAAAAAGQVSLMVVHVQGKHCINAFVTSTLAHEQ